MFQYAIGRALAYRHNTELLLDTRLFKGYGLRTFELEKVFSIKTDVATEDKIKGLIGWKASRIGSRLLKEPRLAFLRGSNYFIEPAVHYVKELCDLPGDCYITGYWQSERYFEDIKNLIRTDFSFPQPLTGYNAEIADKIQSINAVSLHVRRADYVTDRQTSNDHGTCETEYYDKAVMYISKQITSPVFFIFSDDHEWVKSNLSLKYEHHFVSHNSGPDSYKDMHLMSLCKHHIIANSSFSWWGAWLNKNADKIVIAPDRWFLADKYDSSDHVPKDWVRL